MGSMYGISVYLPTFIIKFNPWISPTVIKYENIFFTPAEAWQIEGLGWETPKSGNDTYANNY